MPQLCFKAAVHRKLLRPIVSKQYHKIRKSSSHTDGMCSVLLWPQQCKTLIGLNICMDICILFILTIFVSFSFTDRQTEMKNHCLGLQPIEDAYAHCLSITVIIDWKQQSCIIGRVKHALWLASLICDRVRCLLRVSILFMHDPSGRQGSVQVCFCIRQELK